MLSKVSPAWTTTISSSKLSTCGALPDGPRTLAIACGVEAMVGVDPGVKGVVTGSRGLGSTGVGPPTVMGGNGDAALPALGEGEEPGEPGVPVPVRGCAPGVPVSGSPGPGSLFSSGCLGVSMLI